MFVEYFPLITKFTASKIDINKKCLHVQNIQISKLTIFIFSKCSFFTTKCAPFLLKIGEDSNIND